MLSKSGLSRATNIAAPPTTSLLTHPRLSPAPLFGRTGKCHDERRLMQLVTRNWTAV